MPPPLLKVEALAKHFILHNQNAARIDVIDDISFAVSPGECVVLDGPSGAGKSTLLRCLTLNYLPMAGRVLVHDGKDYVDLVAATPQRVLQLRRDVISYVSQFLRVIPRIPALDIVAEPLISRGENLEAARERAADLLSRLNLPQRLWHLPPATFSGGEQQRVNIARGFIAAKPLLLLDEPTASLDAGNRAVVIRLIVEARERGAAIVGIFHDAEVREAVGTRRIPVTAMQAAA